ncbi:class I lanthipeptide [Corallibacter sp.]|uniref:class I lanthipeptide n=1 Tax=Corallibacter sp. TaxID=2038084 RepID=UPI003A90D62E
MKTQSKELNFNKSSIVELQNSELLKVNGGTDTTNNEQTTLVCGDCILVPTTIRQLTK